MLELVFDTNALITCCQATTQDGPAIKSVLEVCVLRVPMAVHREVLAARALFLDMVIELVERKLWKRTLAEDVVKAAQHRFSGGFVPHTLTILKTGDRRCLK